MIMPNININDYNFIGEKEFKSVVYDTAILTTSAFDPANPSFDNIEVICATTGDVAINSTADYTNLAEDVNNIHGRPIEMMQKSNLAHSISFTAVGITEDALKMALGSVDVQADGGITPKSYLSASDFTTTPLWFIAMRLDGGFFAVKIERFLDTAGVSISTSKAGKGTLAVTLEGFNSISDMNKSPITFYIVEGTSDYTVTFNLQGHGTAIPAQTVEEGGKVTEPTAPTATGYTFGGWYKESGCVNAWVFATDTVTGTTTLYAKWTED